MIFRKKPHAELSSIRWDAHGCPPFTIGADLSFLHRYRNAGINIVTINIGFDLTTQCESLELLRYFHQWIHQHNNEFAIVEDVKKLIESKEKNKLSIAFDIEGCNLLNGNIQMLAHYYSLGVRQMAFAYNTNNAAGGGCLDANIGLTNFGKQLVNECNDIGMLIDCSHVGHQTSMDIIELSKHPVIFSHSNPAKLVSHPRNITDEQILACAKKGGVIGINGIGIFLGHNDIRTERIVEHIDYVAQLVGPKHVGVGLDCVFNPAEIKNFANNNPEIFPSQHGFGDVKVAQPEQFSEISELLALRHYSEDDINNILGENFLRIAKVVWRVNGSLQKKL